MLDPCPFILVFPPYFIFFAFVVPVEPSYLLWFILLALDSFQFSFLFCVAPFSLFNIGIYNHSEYLFTIIIYLFIYFILFIYIYFNLFIYLSINEYILLLLLFIYLLIFIVESSPFP